jgi:hypothetical protein
MYFRHAYKVAEQRSRGEYKTIRVAVDRPFRWIDFEADSRFSTAKYRADTARFTQHYRAWGRWWYGKRFKPAFESKFMRPGKPLRRSFSLPY